MDKARRPASVPAQAAPRQVAAHGVGNGAAIVNRRSGRLPWLAPACGTTRVVSAGFIQAAGYRLGLKSL